MFLGFSYFLFNGFDRKIVLFAAAFIVALISAIYVVFKEQIMLESLREFESFYEFDLQLQQFRVGYAKSFPLAQIVAINATKKSKTRFLISVELRNGTLISLGNWAFASKEFSWREDAAKIAEFLRVPLRIPAV